jgi:hypothetical protein
VCLARDPVFQTLAGNSDDAPQADVGKALLADQLIACVAADPQQGSGLLYCKKSRPFRLVRRRARLR